MKLPSVEKQTDYDPPRRTVIKYLLGFSVVATLGGVVTPIISYLFPARRQASDQHGQVRVASLADLQAAAGLVVAAGDQPVVLTYSQQANVKAFSAICTHLGCVVRWKEDGGYIECPCHDGRFNAQTGAVISGPPPAALPAYEVIVDNDDVYVVL